MSHAVLVLNAGSSSLKFALYAKGAETPQINGLIDRIGAGSAALKLRDADERALTPPPIGTLADHRAALEIVLAATDLHCPDLTVTAVGHRVVHGGPDFAAPVVIDDAVLSALEALIPLAPLHQPHCVAGIRAARAAFPDAAQIACFDTAFHRTMPELNQIYAIPRALYDQGVRRYGFHGLSYDYIACALRAHDPALAAGRVIIAHLGNGASLCAMRDGRSVATSMGFSALDGLAMGTRSGKIDPGVLLYLLDQGTSPAELSEMLYRRSGLLGLSGISSDMRTLEASDKPEAKQAIAYFIQAITRGIAELTATLGGLDTLVFTAGIGENSDLVRAEICKGLGWMGAALNAAANETGAFNIANADAAINLLVIPTREDLVILRAIRAMS
ncbi:MAG: acetate/propionate family kinase [Paracoccus sp. (in: a-proteobacteria)]